MISSVKSNVYTNAIERIMFWFDMNQHRLSLLDHSYPLKQNEVTTEDELFSRK